MKTSVIAKIYAFLAVAVLSAVAIFTANAAAKEAEDAAAAPKPDLTVVIDAGHGGIDSGVTGKESGTKESDLNLSIARELKKLFEEAGIRVVMTRDGEDGLYGELSKGFKMRDMKKRREIINSAGARVMISVHLNHFSDSSRRGAQAFYKKGSEEGLKLATFLQKNLNLSSGQVKRYSPLVGDYYVLNESEPVAALCECCFLSNSEDEKLILSEDYRREIASLIYRGTMEYLAS